MVKLSQAVLDQIYVQFMEEIKIRLLAARHEVSIAAEKRGQPGAYLHAEFAYLQIRRVAEMIAMAVLVLHNEIEDFRTKKFVTQYHPRTIFKKLGELSDTAFPDAFEVTHHDDGAIVEITVVKEGHLTKSNLVKIYDDCGDKLHLGTLKHLAKGRKIYDLDEVNGWLNAIFRLIRQHVVLLPDKRKSIVVFMAYGAEQNVHCFVNDLVEEPSEPILAQ